MRKLMIALLVALVITAPVVAYTLTKDDISFGEGIIEGKLYSAKTTQTFVRVVEDKENETVKELG